MRTSFGPRGLIAQQLDPRVSRRGVRIVQSSARGGPHGPDRLRWFLGRHRYAHEVPASATSATARRCTCPEARTQIGPVSRRHQVRQLHLPERTWRQHLPVVPRHDIDWRSPTAGCRSNVTWLALASIRTFKAPTLPPSLMMLRRAHANRLFFGSSGLRIAKHRAGAASRLSQLTIGQVTPGRAKPAPQTRAEVDTSGRLGDRRS